jgi:hypothetical protein
MGESLLQKMLGGADRGSTAVFSSDSRERRYGAGFLVMRENRYTLDDFARCVVLLRVAPEVIEDTNEVAIKIGGHKLAQLPRFVFGCGNDLRVRGLPLCEEFVNLSLAIEIEPEKDRAYVAVGLSE